MKKEFDSILKKEMNSYYLRKASFEDAFCLFSWKNEEESLKNSRNSTPVSWEDHVKWLTGSLVREDRRIWILEKEGSKLGSLRLDLVQAPQNPGIGELKMAEISYMTDKEQRGKGYGTALLLLAEEEASQWGIDILYGEVLTHNEASRRLFLKLGYQEKREEYGFSYRKSLNTLFFRVDMNEKIATGHVMRCLSVADAAAQKGRKSIFLTADEKPCSLIRSRGHKSLLLHTDWQQPKEELTGLGKLIYEYGINRLLLDSYQVSEAYLEELSKMTEVFYLDDLDAFPYPVQNIICYANYYSKLSYGKKKGERGYYLGMEYMPLRKVFQNREAKLIREEIATVLLLSGGSDPENMIERILNQFLKQEQPKPQKIYVICGSLYPDFSTLVNKYEKFCEEIPAEEVPAEAEEGKKEASESEACKKTGIIIEFHQNVDNLEEYMEEADLAVSAGGTTLYELAAMGVPTITYSFADNQLRNVYQFQEDDLMDYAGDGREEKKNEINKMDTVFHSDSVNIEKERELSIEERILKLYHLYDRSREMRKERSRRLQQMIDGKGAERIAILLEGKEQ